MSTLDTHYDGAPDHADEHGRPMTGSVTVTLPRWAWWLTRNQLRNQADDWRDRGGVMDMAAKCDAVADELDRIVLSSGLVSELNVTGDSPRNGGVS
jgi:hypothetical protein